MIKLKLSSQLIGQFGHVTASASCKQPVSAGLHDAILGDFQEVLNRYTGALAMVIRFRQQCCPVTGIPSLFMSAQVDS